MLYRKDIGLKQIAELAGVSSTTVSRVLRGKGEISDKTRSRVETIASELGYRPNLAVRTMQTGNSFIVGILMNVTNDPGFRGHVLNGIHDILIEADYLPVLIWSKPGNPCFSESRQVHRLIDHRVDGLIFSVENISSDFFQYVDSLDIPVVIIDEIIEGVERDAVVTDNHHGALEAAHHLLDLGHRDIVYFSDREIDDVFEGGRGRPFLEAINETAGATGRSATVAVALGGYEEACTLLRSEDRPTAIFAFNDYVAFQVVRAARDLELGIPEDLSVIGFGNIPHIIDLIPNLTTFEQMPVRIGETASTLLLSRLRDERRGGPIVEKIKPQIISRDSTGPPPGR